MEGLVKGLMMVVLDTFLLAGGEKDVCTGWGKLGGSETWRDADASCACIVGDRGAESEDTLEPGSPLDDVDSRVDRSADFLRVLVEAGLFDLEVG